MGPTTQLVIFDADQNSRAFQEVVIIKHPRAGEYAFGFITSSFTLQVRLLKPYWVVNVFFCVCFLYNCITVIYLFNFFIRDYVKQSYTWDEELYSVYVPTNHLYIGDIFLVHSKEVIRPNLSVREGIGKFSSLLLEVPVLISIWVGLGYALSQNGSNKTLYLKGEHVEWVEIFQIKIFK